MCLPAPRLAIPSGWLHRIQGNRIAIAGADGRGGAFRLDDGRRAACGTADREARPSQGKLSDAAARHQGIGRAKRPPSGIIGE